ncbi:IS200/IS605 family transposase [Clostridiaceae bacterium WCA-383-APC-5B]|uniref:IS200/IS605 family transposase n=1 Tax=Inconstantimicrobium porci TaxID=2652291 RepID=A0A7X2MYM0_9CLOT|nr:IS200/IS605 family transposase [Inconstantimicrobium porci]
MLYNSKNHSKFILRYHIILVCKYRENLMIQYGEFVKENMLSISQKYDFTILEIEVDKNHIHLLVESEPKISPLMIVRVLKQQTTIRLWNKFSDKLSKYFWKERTFFTDGYFVSTIGEVSTETLRKYIQNQG